MRQHELKPPPHARHKKKRVGRGDGSGHGTYSGRGCKGQKSRSGGGVRPGFEGGQLALIKRLPRKRGFTNIFKTEYDIVNVGKLDAFPEASEVNPETLFQKGLIKSSKQPVKILGHGDIHHPLIIRAAKFSETAEKKILAAGGEIHRV